MSSRGWSLRFEPRRWQTEAYAAWSVEKRGIIQVVTGAGKTYFAFLCMNELHNECAELKTFVVVPTLSLLDQWFVNAEEVLSVRESDIAVYSGEERATETRSLNLVVLNTARSMLPSLSAHEPSFLIVDECHRAGSPQNSLALQGQHLATLGLSATPHREYDFGYERHLVPNLGPIQYSYSYSDALKDEILSPFELVNVEVPLAESESDAYKRYSQAIAAQNRSNDDNPTDLKTLLRRRATVSMTAASRIPVAVHLANRHRENRILIFHERIDAANRIYTLMSKREHSVTRYHSGIGSDVRRQNLRLFRRGVYQSIVTCRSLDEGLDVPDVDVGIIASSTASQRQRIQRIGRALRRKDGKSHARIYTLYATDAERKRLEQECQRLTGEVEVHWQEARIPGADG